MGKLAKDLSEILPDFQKFLRERKLSPEKDDLYPCPARHEERPKRPLDALYAEK